MRNKLGLGEICTTIALGILTGVCGSASAKPAPLGKPLPPEFQRIVCVGDSITDGDSYPLLIRQSLVEAGYQAPTMICAGVASDIAAQMHARLDRDVFPYHPTLVTFHAGANDAGHGVTAEMFRAELTAVAERMKQTGIPMILMTPAIRSPEKFEAVEPILLQYCQVVHDVAKQYDLKVAEAHQGMLDARAKGENPIETDTIHPNYRGHQIMARSILDAMGFADVPLPKELKPDMLPGVITDWMIRVKPPKNPALDETTVLTVKPDNTWTHYTLPDKDPLDNWWLNQERQRGFALALDKLVGKGSVYQGVTVIKSRKSRQVWFNTGSGLTELWVNGKALYDNPGMKVWTGWHAGKERIPYQLHRGDNTVVIESSNQFFLSMTDNNDW